jgi:undecaprenyl diphosphate synthase
MTEPNKLPTHVGVIMDGNGRWAKKKGVPRLMGHNAGVESMKRIVIAAAEMGIEYLTVYAFSTENWKRSEEEVSGIFKLIIKYVQSELQELVENNVRISILGKYRMLPKASVDAIDRLLEATKDNTGLVLCIAVNYGGRAEVVKAVNELIRENPECEITEEDISAHLYTGVCHENIPDPDLIIRTSGEERTSNFLLWQSAYSELMFTDTLWPDFGPEEFASLCEQYSHRKRRFGGREKDDQ